jgi:hypothetical protein
MVEACYTVRATTKQQVIKGIGKLTLQTNEHGQYTHDAILLLQKGISCVLVSQFNPSNSGKGMAKLLKDAPAPETDTAHSVADSVSYLQAMTDADTDTNYSESAYATTSDSDSSKEMCKPRGCDRKPKSCHGGREKDKKSAKKQHEKNTCPHCKKFHCTKPHRVSEDKCMWNKK